MTTFKEYCKIFLISLPIIYAVAIIVGVVGLFMGASLRTMLITLLTVTGCIVISFPITWGAIKWIEWVS